MFRTVAGERERGRPGFRNALLLELILHKSGLNYAILGLVFAKQKRFLNGSQIVKEFTKYTWA